MNLKPIHSVLVVAGLVSSGMTPADVATVSFQPSSNTRTQNYLPRSAG